MSYESAVISSYVWIFLPLVVYLLEPRKTLYTLWVLISVVSVEFAPLVPYQCASGTCDYQPNVQDSVTVFLGVWLVITFIQIGFDALANRLIRTSDISLDS